MAKESPCDFYPGEMQDARSGCQGTGVNRGSWSSQMGSVEGPERGASFF